MRNAHAIRPLGCRAVPAVVPVVLIASLVGALLTVLPGAVGGLAGTARANPVDAFGLGARAASMAGAQTAASDDGGASYYNPAILATFDEIRVELGYQLALPALRLRSIDLHTTPSRGTVAGLTVPGRVGRTRVALGGALFLPDQHITRTRTLSAQTPRFVMYDNRPQRLFLAANLSAQLTRHLFVGAGMAYMSSTRGAVLLQGRVGFPDPADSDLSLAIDVDLETIRYGHFGVLYQAAPWLDLGLSYRGGFRLVLDQIFEVRGDVGVDGLEPIVRGGYFHLHTISQDLFQPAQLTAGAYARLTRDWSLAFDVAWQRWSAFENPAAHITIDLDVGELNDLIELPVVPPLPEPGFRDILVPRLGIEWRAARAPAREWLVRGGYAREPSPVPAQVGETNFIDNDKHTLSAGVGLTLHGLSEILPRPLTVDAFVAFTWLGERVHSKLSPADPVGDYRSAGHVTQMGITTRLRL